MKWLVNGLAILCCGVAVLLLGSLIYGLVTDGFADGTGMAILVFQLWGAIAAVGAILFGLASSALGKRQQPPTTRLGKTSGAIGLGVLLVFGILLSIDSF